MDMDLQLLKFHQVVHNPSFQAGEQIKRLVDRWSHGWEGNIKERARMEIESQTLEHIHLHAWVEVAGGVWDYVRGQAVRQLFSRLKHDIE